MSDTDDDSNTSSSEEEEEEEEETENSSSDNEDDEDDDDDDSDDDDDDDEDPHSSDEVTELIQVGDVRTAFSMATNGKNCCKFGQFPAILDTLNIKLNEKRTKEFFTMLDEDATDEVGWNSMFYALRDGQSKFKGLPMDQVVGGLLYEFAASARGRKRQQAVAKKSMISFMQNAGVKMEENKAEDILSPKTPSDEPQAGLEKPTRSIHSQQRSGSTEPTIREDEEEDTFDIDATTKIRTSFKFNPRARAGTATAAPPKPQPLFTRKSTGDRSSSSSNTAKRSSITMKEKQEKPALDLRKLKGPMGQVVGHSLSIQDESLRRLYERISSLEDGIAQKYTNEDIVSGMNNVMTLQNAIKGIAKSSAESLKQDMSDVLNKSAVHSSHQVAKEISSQLTRMNHMINNTNKILSTQSGRDFEEKLDVLEQFLQSIEMNAAARPGSRPLSAYNRRGNSAKYPKTGNKSVQFDFNQKALESLGVAGMGKDDIEPIIDEMEIIKKGVNSLDDSIQKIIADRLLKLEKTVFALFGQIASNKKDSVRLMPVEELAVQLDLQKANFEAEVRKVRLKNDELEKLLQHTKDTASIEKQAAIDERERLLIALGRFLQQEAVVNELRGELKKRLGVALRPKEEEKEDKKEDDINEEDEDDKKEKEDKKRTSAVDIVSAQKHLELNEFEPDSKYDDQTTKYEKKLIKHNTEMQMKALKSILEYKSIDDIPNIDDDEIPDFLRIVSDEDVDAADEPRANDKLLEEQLGFGYHELLRLYRANTDLNVQLSFAKWEREQMTKRLEEAQQPLIINHFGNGKVQEVALQLKLQSLIDQINVEQLELLKHKGTKKKMRMIDKYRLEMYRDAKQEEWRTRRQLREQKLELLRQKRMIKKLFEQTKLKAHKIMDEANEMRKKVKDEIEMYSKKKHEATLAKMKYEDKMSKNKTEMQELYVNEEVAKHIEIYKQHLEDEAERKATEERDEDLEQYKEGLREEFAEKLEEVYEDIEKERMEHEKEVKRLQHEIDQQHKYEEERIEAQKEYVQKVNKIRKDKSNLAGQLRTTQQLYKDLQDEFKAYKADMEDKLASGAGAHGSSQSVNLNGGGRQQRQAMGPIDPEALFAGYHAPSQELKLARKEYKQMKMASGKKAQEIKKLIREKAELAETIGRLETELESQRALVQKRDKELLGIQHVLDSEINTKLRPFVNLVQGVGRDVLHNAPTNYIFNYKKNEFSKVQDDLHQDRSDWYIHKNHILRCYFFSIEEWFRDHFWLHERIVQCNESVHEAMQQVLMDTWMETRIQSHAFIRWFGDLDYQEELKLFYSVQFSQEERYFWNMDMFDMVNAYRSGVVDKYYKDTMAEREERREGYWKRHPDVYSLYKKRYIDTVRRYKKNIKEKKHTVEYMKKEKLDILHEKDLKKIQQEFAQIKQANKLKRQSSQHKPRESGTIDTGNKPRNSGTPSNLRKKRLSSSQSNKRLSQGNNQSLTRQSSNKKNVYNQ